LFLYTATIHAAMALFAAVRIRLREETPSHRDPYEPQPQQATLVTAEFDPRAEQEQSAG
jgi:hypothetical protein